MAKNLTFYRHRNKSFMINFSLPLSHSLSLFGFNCDRSWLVSREHDFQPTYFPCFSWHFRISLIEIIILKDMLSAWERSRENITEVRQKSITGCHTNMELGREGEILKYVCFEFLTFSEVPVGGISEKLMWSNVLCQNS